MGFSTDTGFDQQKSGAEALWPPAFGAAIFDFDGTLAATEGLWEEVDRIFFGTSWGMPATRRAWSSDPVRESTWPR